ncbi:hypothetical protein ACWDZ8_08555, partial [Streptomyces sp. NPDC003233]
GHDGAGGEAGDRAGKLVAEPFGPPATGAPPFLPPPGMPGPYGSPAAPPPPPQPAYAPPPPAWQPPPGYGTTPTVPDPRATAEPDDVKAPVAPGDEDGDGSAP